MQRDGSGPVPYALPYTAHARFWKFGLWPLLWLIFLVLSLVAVPPSAERRWQAYAFVGLIAVPGIYLLGWVVTRRIVVSHEGVHTRALFNRSLAIRYAEIRSAKVKATQVYDAPGHLVNRYLLTITAKSGTVIRIPIQSYHLRDLRVVVDAIVTHAPGVALDLNARQLQAGTFLPRP